MAQEVEFRDGTQVVPDHVADMVAGLETFKMTYKEAIAAAEKRALGDLVGRAQRELIRAHFRETS